MAIESNIKYSHAGIFGDPGLYSTESRVAAFPRPDDGHPGIVFADSELPQEPLETPHERNARFTAETEEFFDRCEKRLRQPNPDVWHIMRLVLDRAEYQQRIVGEEISPGFIAMVGCVCIG